MSNIYKFPATEQIDKNTTPISNVLAKKQNSFVDSIVKIIWLFTVICWPVARWILAIDVAFQFSRMLWHWNTQGTYAGWTFLIHFSVLVVLTFFVNNFKPKKMKTR